MKKLIGWLTALSIIGSSSSMVVSCNKDNSWDVRPDKPKLDSNLAKKLLASISGDSSLADIDFGSFFSSDDATKIVVNMINELISRQYSFDSKNKQISDLGWSSKYGKEDNGSIEQSFRDLYSEDTRSIAEDNLFLEYTKALSSNENYDFNIQAKYLYDLNLVSKTSVKLLNDNDGKLSGKTAELDPSNVNDKAIYFKKNGKGKSLLWKYSGEIVPGITDKDEDIQTSNLPTINDLTAEYSKIEEEDKTKFYVDKDCTKRVSAKTALFIRFQQYFESKLLEDINTNLLTKSFLDANMFKIKSEGTSESGVKNGVYLNTASPIFSKTQSWSNNTNEKLKTNVKMVWTVKYDNTKKDLDLESEIKTKLKKFINPANGEMLSPSETSITDILEILSKLGEQSKEETPTNPYNPVIDDSNSYDPYFGQGGFKGFTIYNNDSSIGDSPISGANYESAVKSWNNGPGIILKSPEKYSFTDKDNGNYEEIVVVLPVYMIELLGGSGANIYQIKGKDQADTIDINLGKSVSNKTEFKDIWDRPINEKLHTKDIQDLIADSSKRDSMLNQLKYLVSNDSTSSELAKTSLYSLYLDKDLVYYAGLYNEIGKYIKNEDDYDE
ncbi:hypothetical protein SCORR_v1c02070 [Spiroplasma corruscae]|uniref:Lipoprotein n=1 Tax=Spiroplasma corruscae TaxID=216934 RepID=A0A222ENA4_9MOLU|nr:lipoprotein [Spiroplasma corruscae]ASP27982.1 hypothetical protein SCORR_v1c02070 [Spiroplasma corruscae]